MRARQLASLLGPVATLFVAGCEAGVVPAPDLAPVVWSGEHIEFATNGDAQYCAGSPGYLDRFAGRVRDDMDVDADERVRIYFMSDEALDQVDVCTDTSRCVYRGKTYTDVAVDTHELVHALRYAALGKAEGPRRGTTVFEEGLAVLHELDDTWLDPERRIEDAVDSVPDLKSHMQAKYYGVAGDFSRFLELENGIESLTEFVNGQGDLDNPEELRDRYEEFFGENFEEAAARYRAEYPLCSSFARIRHPVECSAEPLVPDGIGLSFESSLSCDDSDTVGPVDGRMWTSFTFDVAEAGNYVFTNIAEPFGYRLEVVDCDRGCLGADHSIDQPITLFTSFDLESGRYLVRLSRPVDEPGDVHLNIGGF